jgi:nucleoside phosphorylase
MTRTHEDYTVGWICPLPLELAAARRMLDEEHENLPAERNDHNVYTLGRIGTHNVVLASLPVGEHRVVSAAITVMDIMSTFPCLKIGLVVGVAGGVPSEKHDIRMGDVVVGSSGVFHYDNGKTVQGARSDPVPQRLQAPENLLRALSNLQANHRVEEPRMNAYIDTMAACYPDFMHPGQETDFLYASSYDHPEETVSCAKCDPAQRVSRMSRPSTRPIVHYGLIASGSQLMRHGSTCDKLRKQHDVLCFEMEAAGVMRAFPSLVIRGICDYAESHKNKAWQNYAAVTAAAYAKELLSNITGPLCLTGKCFMVPFLRTQNFVGRADTLAMIQNKLQAREPAVLAGTGGVG